MDNWEKIINGYREKAIAIYQGKADISMCLPFLKDKAEFDEAYEKYIQEHPDQE